MIIGVVYKSKDGTWRGFCSPFDISCTAKTANGAMKKMDVLMKVYIEGLHKYGYPSRLAVKEISDEEDRKVFEKVLKYVIKDMATKMRKDFDKFQLETKTNSFRITDNIKAMGKYSFLQTNTPTLVGNR